MLRHPIQALVSSGRNTKLHIFCWGGWAFLNLLTGCSPSRPLSTLEGSRGSVQLKLNADNSLPAQLCYAIHVTGEGLEQLNPRDWVCGPSVGLGQISAQAYRLGDTAEIVVKLGPQRHFDLIGMESPLGLDAEGKALCGALSVEVTPGSLPIERKLQIKMNGQLVTAKPALYATGTADINPGDNTIDLSPASSPGAPYIRADEANAPALCRVAPPPPAKAALTLFRVTGVALSGAITSTGAQQLLRAQALPELMSAPVQGAGGLTLETGFEKIQAHYTKP